MQYWSQGKVRVMVSEDFIKAVQEYPLQKHIIAVKAGVTPAFLSNIMNRILKVWAQDVRVKRVAKVVGFSGECFGE